ncbi:hypothetical protein GALMADRAFT_135497 [Galerina marginata CBS 339.88]|uniref:AAA+ ATPase domain-containing protein n=1 Tax=Galerina marginata (strain CBS 339.88) TaxID=685588 RepID=A0A067TQE0_GALM3|nr:hypothetical protein GALMADRAFT_135497 [Galerina marginata CBS 339.88]
MVKPEKFQSNDIVILIMGLSGAGKSTFINVLLKERRMPVNEGLVPLLTEPDYAIIDPIPAHLYPNLVGRRLVIVDTPGFMDSPAEDMKTLRKIAEWLDLRYRIGTTLGGVIFLQDISIMRLSTTSRSMPGLLLQSFGGSKEPLRKLVLATTLWERTSPEIGGLRENDLRDTCWRTFANRGSEVHQFRNTADVESAWKIVNVLLSQVTEAYPQAQPPRVAGGVWKELKSTRKRTRNREDTNTFRSTDIVILVTGRTGSGKSVFINTLLDKTRMSVMESLTSSPTGMEYEIIDPIPERYNLRNCRLVIVEAPGFSNSDPDMNDRKILQQITEWLEARFPDGITLGGVIYLHEISSYRFSTMKDIILRMLEKAFGKSKEAYGRVILATTKWGRLRPQEGEQREKELRETSWRALIERGSTVERFQDSAESAWRIVSVLLDRPGGEELRFEIQQGLADLRKLVQLAGSSENKEPLLLRQVSWFFGAMLDRSV